MGHDRDGGMDYVLADTSNGGFCDEDPPGPTPSCVLTRSQPSYTTSSR